VEWSGDLLVLGVFESELKTEGEGDAAVTTVDGAELKALDAAMGGLLTELVAEAEFKAKVTVRSQPHPSTQRLNCAW
jgi:hypothetical protein